jgi:hypothetical protein
VQELVGIYDGLTRAASEEPPTIDGRGVSQTRNGEQLSDWRGNGEDDEVGFGDFKHAPVNDERAPRSSGEASMSSELSSTPKAEIEDGFAQE